MEVKKTVIDSNQNIVVLRIRGKIKSGYLTGFEEEFKKLPNGAVKLILDLSEVDAIDSSGIGQLVKARTDTINAGGNVVLMTSGRVQTIIRLSGLENYFKIATTQEEAIELVKQLPEKPPQESIEPEEESTPE